MKIEYYDGIYTDIFDSVPIRIINNFKFLSFKIRNISFIATDFDDLTIHNTSTLTQDQAQQFTWAKDALIKYKLQINLPLTIIEIENQQIFQFRSNLQIEMHQTVYSAHLDFELAGQCYSASHSDFEGLFDQIQRQFQGKYRFKNCYGCLYADYSVYGQAQMGSMGCFKKQKSNYLAVKNKDDYMQLDAVDFCNQEIFCCEDYTIRDQQVGYRGTID